MPFRRPRIRRKKFAPAQVTYTTTETQKNGARPCVYATCLFLGTRVGPIWSHSDQAVKRALASLTRECECPAKFHRAMEFSGSRVATEVKMVDP